MDDHGREGSFDLDALRWRSVLERDGRWDGLFYYAVQTTGVYCRPSCASKKPKRNRVEFFTSVLAAEQAGYRPCLRCRPDDISPSKRQAALVASLCKYIAESESLPHLEDLAKEVGLSRSHFHRIFKLTTGSTPKAYALAHRAQRFKNQLAAGASVTDAMYAAGFGASSRLYAVTDRFLGMPPSTYRKGGTSMKINFSFGMSYLGKVLVAVTDKGICAVLLGDDEGVLKNDLQKRFPEAELQQGNKECENLLSKVIQKLEMPHLSVELPLDLQGTIFQHRVWQALMKIAPGKTESYVDVARRIGRPNAARAVALACRANPAAVIVPCHRVIRHDGRFSGYRWGVERKKQLLLHEGASFADNRLPRDEAKPSALMFHNLSTDQQLHYRLIEGDPGKPWLIFLHEGLGCIAMWKQFPDKLCGLTGCRGLIYDRLGYGRTAAFDAPRTIHYLHASALRELPEVIDGVLPKQQYILIGHSDGGTIALIHGAERNKYLRGIITEAAHIFVEDETIRGIEEAVAAYEKGAFQGLVKYHGEKAASVFHAWADTWCSPWFRSWNIEYLLPSIIAPLLVIQGVDDQYGTERQAKTIASKVIGPVELSLIEQCGHTPHHERQEQVLQRIAGFIARLLES